MWRWKNFDKKISKLILIRKVSELDQPLQDFIPMKMRINFYMFCAFVKNKLCCNVKWDLIIIIQSKSFKIRNSQLFK